MKSSRPPETRAAVHESIHTAGQARSSAFVRWALSSALVLVVLAPAATFLDFPVARAFRPRQSDERFYPALGRLTKVVTLCEVFGYGGTVVLLVLVAGQLDPAGLRSVPRLLCGAFGAGLAADGVKLLIARTRPRVTDLDAGIATFRGWLPILDEATRKYQLQSFPSAHTATAFGLATVLAWRYPRGTAIFFVLAALSGLQRIQVADHFLSDVLAGAVVGILCGALCVSHRCPGGWFDLLEGSRRSGNASIP